eukprot:TRINITY_DN68587_c0_g1_i1.p2 TRINITY_DN68587_c0_g1~~TRINITY_DN68587_c0_g1_i1.p2  ORF type:complete len:291 (+),score=49.29 TRINITY_DN68587_c0_g1_i1:58-930(+)
MPGGGYESFGASFTETVLADIERREEMSKPTEEAARNAKFAAYKTQLREIRKLEGEVDFLNGCWDAGYREEKAVRTKKEARPTNWFERKKLNDSLSASLRLEQEAAAAEEARLNTPPPQRTEEEELEHLKSKKKAHENKIYSIWPAARTEEDLATSPIRGARSPANSRPSSAALVQEQNEQLKWALGSKDDQIDALTKHVEEMTEHIKKQNEKETQLEDEVKDKEAECNFLALRLSEAQITINEQVAEIQKLRNELKIREQQSNRPAGPSPQNETPTPPTNSSPQTTAST